MATGTITLTDKQWLQVHMGLHARIEELDDLIEANKDYPDAEGQVEDWEMQKMEARAAIRILEGA